MKLVQEVRFELLPVKVRAIKGGQYKMTLYVKLAEEVLWSNFLREKLVKVVSCLSTFLVNPSLEKLFNQNAFRIQVI